MNALILKRSRNGKGVFANKNFKKGGLITAFHGQILHYDEIEDNSYEDGHSIQIGNNAYLGPSKKLDDFINHSCNPNSGLRLIGKQLQLVAIRDIKKGDEITWDYSTSMNESHWEMGCNCGSRNCRKRIRDFKHLPKETQQKYVKLGIVPSFIANHKNNYSKGNK